MDPLYGIDVSNVNGPVDWTSVKASGISWAMLKLTEGTGFIDPRFSANWEGAQAQGLVVGIYHFARVDLGTNATDEARYFLAHLPANLPVGTLIALDMEMPTDTSLAPSYLSDWALTWLKTVEATLGFPPLIYSYPYYTTRNLIDPALAHYPLWLAAYSGGLPPSISVWPYVTLWQYTDNASVKGVPGVVDSDQVWRTLDDLKALGKPGKPITKPGDPKWPHHYELTVAEKLRPLPAQWCPHFGPLLPKGTRLADEKPRWPLKEQAGDWIWLRTGGDRGGYVLKSHAEKLLP